MRLAPHQIRALLSCVRRHYGTDAQVLLFGSRRDDAARGGDVDLQVESAAPGSAFVRIARSRAQPLESA